MIVQFRTVMFEKEPFAEIPVLIVEGPACASASLNPLQSIVTLLVRMSTARILVALVITFWPEAPGARGGDHGRHRIDVADAAVIALGGRRRVGRGSQESDRNTEHQQRSQGAHDVLPRAAALPIAPNRADSHC